MTQSRIKEEECTYSTRNSKYVVLEMLFFGHDKCPLPKYVFSLPYEEKKRHVELINRIYEEVIYFIEENDFNFEEEE